MDLILEKLESLDELKQIVTSLRSNQEVTNAKLEALTMDVHHIKGDTTALKSDVAVLKTDVAVLKTDVAVLKTDVSVLKTDVAVLKTDVSVLKTDVKGLTNSNDRLERILERLSIRSIEHEADITEIRRAK
ncbi:MAG TPA: hypothetical protein VGE40_11255 [Bacilli bacterium]